MKWGESSHSIQKKNGFSPFFFETQKNVMKDGHEIDDERNEVGGNEDVQMMKECQSSCKEFGKLLQSHGIYELVE